MEIRIVKGKIIKIRISSEVLFIIIIIVNIIIIVIRESMEKALTLERELAERKESTRLETEGINFLMKCFNRLIIMSQLKYRSLDTSRSNYFSLKKLVI